MSFSDETLFQINVPDENFATLYAKLDLATFPDELKDAGWKYGAPLADIKRLAGKWRSGYDWRKHESELNKELPMFITMFTRRAMWSMPFRSPWM